MPPPFNHIIFHSPIPIHKLNADIIKTIIIYIFLVFTIDIIYTVHTN